MAQLIRSFVALRWRLLRGSLRGKGTEKVGVILSTIASLVLGVGIGLAIAASGRTVSDDENLFVLFCVVVAFGIVGVSVVAGVTQPIDPRVIAAEPLSDRDRAIGLLASAASGPPGLSGGLIGVGLVIGATRGAASLVIVVPAVLAWLATLLLLTRTATNTLGLLSNRFPRTGQIIVGSVRSRVLRLVPGRPRRSREPRPRRARPDRAGALPQPGRPTRASAGRGRRVDGRRRRAISRSARSGCRSSPPCSNRRRTRSPSRHGAVRTRRTAPSISPLASPSTVRRLVRRACGSGGVGAIAWRSLLTRFRTPRTALETFTGAGVGLAAVLVPTLLRDAAGGGAVLVGGAIQLAVLFMSGNSFGNDGPALAYELVAGAGPATLARGKTRSIAIVAAPLVVIGPLLAAAITQEWEYLPAGVMVGVGGLLAGAGGAIVQSTVVPVAIPESDNPFAGGETGRGMMAALAPRRGAPRPRRRHASGCAGAPVGQRPRLVGAGDRVRCRDGGGRVGGDARRNLVLDVAPDRPRTRVHQRHHTLTLTDSVGCDVDRGGCRPRDRGGRGRDRCRQVPLHPGQQGAHAGARRIARSACMPSTTRCAPSSRSPTPLARRCSTRSIVTVAASAIAWHRGRRISIRSASPTTPGRSCAACSTRSPARIRHPTPWRHPLPSHLRPAREGFDTVRRQRYARAHGTGPHRH